jgi:hypothetical protein
MTWRHWLGFFGAFAALKWIMGHYGEEAGAYVVLGLLAAVMVVAYVLHAHRQHTEVAVAQAEPEERARLLADLPPGRAAALRFSMRSFEDIDPSIEPPVAEFSYLPASRGLTTVLFWTSAVCGAGLLLPLLRSQVADSGTAVALVIAAALFILAARGYQVGHRGAGVRVRVDADGLTESAAAGGTTHLPWTQLAKVTYRRWSGILEYEGTSGQRIRIGTTLIDFAHFVQLTLVHRYRASLRGGA